MSDRPARIIRIISQLQISGPALQAVLLTAHLQERGYNGLLVSGSSDPDPDSMIHTAQEYNVQLCILPELQRSYNPLQHLIAFWKLYRLLRDEQPDIVHTHNMGAGFPGRIAARLAGVPVVVHTLHEYPFRGYYDRLRTVLFIYMERLGAHLSDSIITLSEGLRKELTDRYHITSRARMTVLPLGFDLQIFSGTPRHQGNFRNDWHIEPDAPLVGIVGRLLPVKNHALFLEAAARVHQEQPDARFVIVGDGELRPSLEQKARDLGIRRQVIFTGWQQHMERIYSDLDVLTISSWNEGTPVPLIEALAAGCPVVATRVGGIPDLLDGGRWGELVPEGNPRALAEAILRTLRHPPEMQPAQQTMLNRYGIQRLADDLDSLYRGLLAKNTLGNPADS
jgi:glycosyltransferase involved in cell wall biosynthesis